MPRPTGVDPGLVASMYADGGTYESIGAAVGISGSQVGNLIKTHAPHLLKGKGTAKAYDRALAIQMFSDGLGVREICAIVGVSTVTIRALLKARAPHLYKARQDQTQKRIALRKESHSFKAPAFHKPIDDAQFLKLRGEGLPLARIALVMGVTKNRVKRHSQRHPCDAKRIRVQMEDAAASMLYAEGAAVARICTTLKMGRDRVRRVLALPPPKPVALEPNRAEVVRRYADGMLLKHIARDLGVGVGRIRGIIAQDAPHLLKRLNPIDPALVIAAYPQAGSLNKTGNGLGVSRNVVMNVLKKHAPHLRKGVGHSPLDYDRDMAVELYREGLSYAEIGRRMGIKSATIGALIGRRAPELKRGCVKSSFDKKSAIKKYSEGMSTQEVGFMFGVSSSTICNLLKDEAPDLLRPPGSHKKWKPFNKLEAIKLYKSGMTSAEVGDVFGVTSRVILRLVARQEPHLLKGASHSLKVFDRETAVRMYAEGIATSKISKHYGVCDKTILNCVRMLAPHLIKGYEKRQYDRELVVSMFRDGMSPASIAGHVGIARRSVSDLIEKVAPDLLEERKRQDVDFKIAQARVRFQVDLKRELARAKGVEPLPPI